MKKFIVPLFLIALLFCSCKKNITEGGGNIAKTEDVGGEVMSAYNDANINFKIPEQWQKNFKAVTRNVGSSGNTYDQTDFYYTVGERDISIMSLAKFTGEQWDELVKKEKDAEKMLLGKSKDGKSVYSLRFENLDYITDADLKASLKQIADSADSIRRQIVIK